MATDPRVEELRKALAEEGCVIIVGSGVSVAATTWTGDPDRNPVTWKGLLHRGVDECRKLDSTLTDRWAERVREEIDLNDLDDLLAAADKITSKLGGAKGGSFGRWLRESFKDVKVTHDAVPKALGDLGVPLLTTNYDSVLEQATGRQHFTWLDHAYAEHVVRGAEQGILHLHGHYQKAESVVLGVRSYEKLLQDHAAQALQRAFRSLKTIIFVGTGGTLDDPNFDELRRWARAATGGSHYRHYILCRDKDVADLDAKYRADALMAVPYGPDYGDLASFLADLASARSGRAPPAPVVDPKALRPRVLIAGPGFGLTSADRGKAAAAWHDPAHPFHALSMREVTLFSTTWEQAHIGAFTRYDVILDVSPWRSFSRWHSQGLRDAEDATSPDDLAAWTREGAAWMFFAFDEDDTTRLDDEAPAALLARIEALAKRWPAVAQALERAAVEGVAVSGFHDASAAWWRALAPLTGAAPILTDADLPSLDGRAPVRAAEALDLPLSRPTLDHYKRALRVAAGQVQLSGEVERRPLQQVFVQLAVKDWTHPDPRRPTAEDTDDPDDPARDGRRAGRPDAGELEAELEAREQARRSHHQTRTVAAEQVAALGPRVMLWGAAGTGKSTLLRRLAVEALRGDHLPLWIFRIELDASPLDEQFAARALRAVGLPDLPSPALDALRGAITSGHAQLFLDGLDESRVEIQTTLLHRLRDLPSPVLVTSRPDVHGVDPDRAGFVPVDLWGLGPFGAEAFLGAYFPGEPWTQPLLRELRTLLDGSTWARTPVLLAMAASLYREDRRLPHATLDLYQRIIAHLLDRAERRWPGLTAEQRDEATQHLHALAFRMLGPCADDPQIAISRADVRSPFLLTAGLFTGGDWLRFAHLTLGEYLAAQTLQTPTELEHARTCLANRHHAALYTTPIAHALRAPQALLAALDEAERHDEDDSRYTHARLALVLRAVVWGGDGVQIFARQHASRLLRLVIGRFLAPHGRFSDPELRLALYAQRAAPILCEGLSEADADLLRRVGELRGRIGVEALMIGWAARLIAPGRHPGFARAGDRVGECLVDAEVDLRGVIDLTAGEASSSVRQTAASALSGDPESRPLLRDALRDDDPDVRQAAVSALSSDPESRPLLRDALRDKDWRVRQAAFSALSSDPESRPLLRDALRDKDWRVRHAAFSALSSDPESRPLLRDALRDDDPDVRQAAVSALSSDPESRPLLRDALRDKDWRVRQAAFSALSSDPESRPLLRDALRDDDPDVRQAAFSALSSDPESRPLLRDALRDDDPDVRQAAVSALSSDPESRPLLRDALRDKDWRVRQAAFSALSSDPESRPLLRDALRDDDPDVRQAAVSALSSDPESRPLLRDALRDDDPDVRQAAFSALSSDPESRPLLRDALRDDDPDVRQAAVSALSSDPESRPLLRDALRDGSSAVRHAAFSALSSDPESRPLLRDALRDDDPDVRQAAVSALHAKVLEDGLPLQAQPWLTVPSHAHGHPTAHEYPVSAAMQVQAERLQRFASSPRSYTLKRDPAFMEALIGWLCLRMVQVTTPPKGTPALYGHIKEAPTPEQLRGDGRLCIVLRIAMSASELPVERNVCVVHNLLEAWRVARHLQTERDIQIWLACGEVAFEDLVPPELEPGQLYAAAPFFGFRLPGPGSAPREAWPELVALRSASLGWELMSEEERRDLCQHLDALAGSPDLEPWALVPLLAHVGSMLPDELRRRLLARVEACSVEGATRLLEQARGVAGGAPEPNATEQPEAARAPQDEG